MISQAVMKWRVGWWASVLGAYIRLLNDRTWSKSEWALIAKSEKVECSLQLLLWISQMCSVKYDNKMMDQSVSAHWLSVRVVGFLFVRDSRCIALKTDKGPENTTHFDPNYLIWSVVGGFDWWIEQISSGISYFLEFWVIRWVDNNFTWLT